VIHGPSLDQGRTLPGVLIEDSLTVHTPVDRLWAFIQDVERIAPCLPGAELTEVIDDRTWKGKVLVKFGPVQMSFSGTVVMEEKDGVAHRATLSAKGAEQRGKGVANAKVESWLEPAGDDGTTVHIRSDITITGAAAQMSRGLLPEVSKLLTRQFADCLEATLNEESPGAEATVHGTTPVERKPVGEAEPTQRPAAQSVGGFGLGLRALWATIARFFSRLFGRRIGS
jgi:carbon monoxide dehydrogenase subunit G